MYAIKAIETVYKGYRFRSRLEARWAVFFDALGIEWEYEKEGYDLGAAGWYLPDFWLPHFGWWEVKGAIPTDAEVTKICALSEGTSTPGFLSWGKPVPWSRADDKTLESCVNDATVHLPTSWGSHGWRSPRQDGLCGMVEWVQCRVCGHVFPASPVQNICFGIDVGICEHGRALDAKGHYNAQSTDIVQAAYRAANAARFEHGERGA